LEKLQHDDAQTAIRPRSVIKSSYLDYRDYWFTDEFILRVNVLPFLLVLTIDFIVFLLLLLILRSGLGLLLNLILSYIISRLIIRELAKRVRRRLSAMSPEDLINNRKLAKRLDWTEPSSVELKGQKVKIHLLTEGRLATSL
jgi:hypothetical protein